MRLFRLRSEYVTELIISVSVIIVGYSTNLKQTFKGLLTIPDRPVKVTISEKSQRKFGASGTGVNFDHRGL